MRRLLVDDTGCGQFSFRAYAFGLLVRISRYRADLHDCSLVCPPPRLAVLFSILGRGFPSPFSTDPLQILFTGSLMAAAMALGSAVGLLRSPSYGLWGFLLNVSVLLSLLFAQAINYLFHRDIIQKV